MLCEPPMVQYHQLQDGTYSLDDVLVMNEILDLKNELKTKGAK